MKRFVSKCLNKARAAMTRAAGEKGFTLVELVVVIAILGILAGVGTVGYSGYVKKANMAADEQLLAHVNQSFAAACIENGIDARSLTSASAPLNTDKTVDIENVSPYASEFAKYFAGSENTAFKVAEYLIFSNGMFGFGEGENIYDALLEIFAGMEDEIDLVKLSAFYTADGLGVNGLMNKVGGLTGLVASVVKAPYTPAEGGEEVPGNGAYDLLMGYTETLATKMGSEEAAGALINDKIAKMAAADPNGFGKLTEGEQWDKAMYEVLANFAVIQAAEKMTDTTVNDTLALLQNPNTNFVNIMKDDSSTGVAQASLVYGLYTAYAYSIEDPTERAAAIKKADNPQLLLSGIKDPAFVEYLNESSEMQNDVNGYVAAMELINSCSGDKDALGKLLVNGFNDPALGVVLQQAVSK